MLKRLRSFLESGNKLTLFRHFLHEVKSDITTVLRNTKSNFIRRNKQFPGKLNFNDQLDSSFGNHRSSWKSISNLRKLHNPHGTLMDLFIERTFAWNPKGVKPHIQPWVGFIHVPPYVPDWLPRNQANDEIFKTDAWKISYPHCKGLFTFSEYHKTVLEEKLDLPIVSLLHPTEFPEITWSWERFNQNKEKKIIQIGWWLRKIYSIYRLRVEGYQKIFLRKNEDNMEEILKREFEHTPENEFLTSVFMAQTKTLKFLSNRKYDRLLSENIVFLDLYDASANNAIVECIARNTPILVNPIEPVVEYLGRDYPFYFNSLEEAALKAESIDLVRETYIYLVNHPFKYKLSGDYFRESLINSAIYQSL